MKVYKSILIISIILGLVYGILGSILFEKVFDGLPTVVSVPLFMFIFFALISVVLFVAVSATGNSPEGKVVIIAIIVAVITTLLTGVFEFLYELGNEEKTFVESNNYVFLVDNSGSMGSNDPNFERYTALNNLIQNLDQDKTVGVYTFANEVVSIIPIGTSVSQVQPINQNISDGGTAMLSSIDVGLSEINKANLTDAKFVILTDGIASDKDSYNLSRLLKNCVAHNISISGVGFGTPDEDYMKEIADYTNGIYVDAIDVSNLYTSLEQAVNYTGDGVNRTLISLRADQKRDSLVYAFLRILFLLVISVGIVFIKSFLIDPEQGQNTMGTGVSIGCAALASILMEVFTNGFGASDTIARIICCILWAIAVMIYKETERKVFSGGTINTGSSTWDTEDKFGKYRNNGPAKELGSKW